MSVLALRDHRVELETALLQLRRCPGCIGRVGLAPGFGRGRVAAVGMMDICNGDLLRLLGAAEKAGCR